MAQPRFLARGLLISFLLIALLAAPGALTFTWAGAAAIQQAQTATGTPTETATATSSPSADTSTDLQAAPLSVPMPHIVISEFRSRGPSSNGHETDEFIELFNPNPSGTINLTGWSLWKTDCIAPPQEIVAAIPGGTILPAGHHYLIAGQNYSGVVHANNTVNIDLADNGGIQLRDNLLAVQDAVGMCSTATGYFEDTALTALAGNSDQGYDRKTDSAPGGACIDTDHNRADFFLRSPSDPQNNDSPVTQCGNPTATPILAPTRVPTGLVVINEIGWAGTKSDPLAQWIELYNTTSQPISLADWTVEGPNTGFNINLKGTITARDPLIPGSGYFLLVHGIPADATATPASVPDCTVFKTSSVAKYDQVFSQTLSQTGELLQLFFGSTREDSAGGNFTPWWAGKTDGPRSMERTGPVAIPNIAPNDATGWFTYGIAANPAIQDCGGNDVFGTPKQLNWATTVLITPSPLPPPTKKPKPPVPTPFAHMLINEFLPRAGTDWNHDGTVNVYDEFIEIKNLGPIDLANLAGWKLDDAANPAHSYTLPTMKLKAGERALFYRSTTNIALADSGGTVRLLNPSGVVFDARGYGPVGKPDVSHCRIPDGFYWQLACYPTPGNENSLTNSAAGPPPIVAVLPPPCLLPDTVPEAFRLGECAPYGGDIWNRTYWDDQAGNREFPVPDAYNKWKTIVE